MKNILLTGGSGQIGHFIGEALRGAPAFAEFVFQLPTRKEFDLDQPDRITQRLDQLQPDLVVNCAAWTQVDLAQTEAAACERANAVSPAKIAQWCAAHNTGLIHFSTDYVFEGRSNRPYLPSDRCSPLGVYGASKLAGEKAIIESGAKALILRTGWVVSPHGKNFLLTMLRLFWQHETLRVVADQYGAPSSAPAIAKWLLEFVLHPMLIRQADGDALSRQKISSRSEATAWLEEHSGVFHLTGAGVSTWHGLAQFILEHAKRYESSLPPSKRTIRTNAIEAIITAQYPTPAPRPAYSVLDNSETIRSFGASLGPWQEDVSPCIYAALQGGTPQAPS